MKINYLILPIVLFLFCFLGSIYLFTIPAKDLPEISWMRIPYLDKFIHIGIFLSLCISATILRSRISEQKITNSTVLVISILFIIYGIGIEFYQESYVEGRSFEIADILADSFGCSLFLAWFYIGGFAKKVGPCRNRGLNQN